MGKSLTIKDSSFFVAEPGQYKAVFCDADVIERLKYKSQNTEEVFLLTVNSLEPVPPLAENADADFLSMKMWITPTTFKKSKFIAICKALRIEIEPGADFDCEAFLNIPFLITVGIEELDIPGEYRNVVTGLTAIPKPVSKPVSKPVIAKVVPTSKLKTKSASEGEYNPFADE